MQERTRAKPHSRDLRKGRISEPGRTYHIRSATAERRPVFANFALGREVVKSMRFLHERGDVESLVFVVMPDHAHWLFQLKDQRGLDEVIGSWKRHTARVINRRIGQVGRQLWQAGYFERALREEEDVRTVGRYIVANPLRAALCLEMGDYPLWDAVWL